MFGCALRDTGYLTRPSAVSTVGALGIVAAVQCTEQQHGVDLDFDFAFDDLREENFVGEVYPL